MPLDSKRLARAKAILRANYVRTGGLPSVATFAKEMGYTSPASAFDVTQALVAAQFLTKGPSGRLLPGALFERPMATVPEEMLAILPEGKTTRALRVPDDSLIDAGILAGDFLVVVEADSASAGHFVLTKGTKLTVREDLVEGWSVEGRLVGQFRGY